VGLQGRGTQLKEIPNGMFWLLSWSVELLIVVGWCSFMVFVVDGLGKFMTW
jgi:hypothetical protein